jgi:hypothetical protein
MPGLFFWTIEIHVLAAENATVHWIMSEVTDLVRPPSALRDLAIVARTSALTKVSD